jgi:hypothetical protein
MRTLTNNQLLRTPGWAVRQLVNIDEERNIVSPRDISFILKVHREYLMSNHNIEIYQSAMQVLVSVLA